MATDSRRDPQLLQAIYEQLPASYWEGLNEQVGFSKIIERRLREWGVSGGDLWDVGCGNGNLLRTFGNQWNKHGIEPGHQAVDEGRGLNLDVRLGTASALRLRGVADVVLLIDVAEHLPDPELELLAIKDMLRPNGTLVLLTGTADAWTARFAGNRWYYLHCVGHVTIFGARSFDRLLSELGFVDIASERFEHPGSIGARRWLQRIGGNAPHRARQAAGGDALLSRSSNGFRSKTDRIRVEMNPVESQPAAESIATTSVGGEPSTRRFRVLFCSWSELDIASGTPVIVCDMLKHFLISDAQVFTEANVDQKRRRTTNVEHRINTYRFHAQAWPFRRGHRIRSRLARLGLPVLVGQLVRLIHRFKPDCIFAIYAQPHWIAATWMASRITGVPLVYHIHDAFLEVEERRQNSELAKWLERKTLTSARVLALTTTWPSTTSENTASSARSSGTSWSTSRFLRERSPSRQAS